MAKGPESQLKDRVLKALEKHGGYWFKTHGDRFTGRGIPDIVGCYKGHFVGIELKDPGKVPTDIQAYNLTKIHEAGGRQGAAETVAQALVIALRKEVRE